MIMIATCLHCDHPQEVAMDVLDAKCERCNQWWTLDDADHEPEPLHDHIDDFSDADQGL